MEDISSICICIFITFSQESSSLFSGSPLPALEVDCDWVLPDAGIIKKSYTVVCPSHCLDVNHCIRVKVNNTVFTYLFNRKQTHSILGLSML